MDFNQRTWFACYGEERTLKASKGEPCRRKGPDGT